MSKKEGWTQHNPFTAQRCVEWLTDFCSRRSFQRPQQDSQAIDGSWVATGAGSTNSNDDTNSSGIDTSDDDSNLQLAIMNSMETRIEQNHHGTAMSMSTDTDSNKPPLIDASSGELILLAQYVNKLADSNSSDVDDDTDMDNDETSTDDECNHGMDSDDNDDGANSNVDIDDVFQAVDMSRSTKIEKLKKTTLENVSIQPSALIQFHLPDHKIMVRRFELNAKVEMLYSFVEVSKEKVLV